MYEYMFYTYIGVLVVFIFKGYQYIYKIDTTENNNDEFERFPELSLFISKPIKLLSFKNLLKVRAPELKLLLSEKPFH